MTPVPDHIITTLVRCLPLILSAVRPDWRDTRTLNAVRLVSLALKKLKTIERKTNDAKTRQNHSR